jgi:hypothetical protein
VFSRHVIWQARARHVWSAGFQPAVLSQRDADKMSALQGGMVTPGP